MISSYLKTGFRNLKKEKLSSIINIVGLTAGILATMLIATYIYAELGYDSFHKKSDRIVRLLTISDNKEDKGERTGLTMVPLIDEYSKIEGVETPTRIFRGWGGSTARLKDKVFKNIPVLYTDNNFFRLFDFRVLSGSVERALMDPASVVINRSTAIKIFGTAEVAGRSLQMDSMAQRGFSDFTVTAVIEDAPYNSHFTYTALMPFDNLKWMKKQKSNEVFNYFAVKEGYNKEAVLAQVKRTCDEIYKPRLKYGYRAQVGFQNLKDIRLYSSDVRFDFIADHGSIIRVYVFSTFPFIILFIAGLNYINILNARLQNRFREIGLRKVMGAGKRGLIFQFAGESLVTVLITGFISILLYFSLLKGFGRLVEMNLTAFETQWFTIPVLTIAVAVFIGLVASLFPGYIVSRDRTVSLFDGPGVGRKKNYLVNFTVLIQFSVVVVLMIATLVIYSQLEYMKNIDPGFRREQVLNFNVSKPATGAILKERLLQSTDIVSVAGSSSIPGKRRSGQLLTNFGGKDLGDRYKMSENRVAAGFLKTYGIELIAGRDFIENSEADRKSVIVNEELINKAGVTAEEAIGKKIRYIKREFTVIGVVRNYHFSSLKQKIEPLVLSNYRPDFYTVSVRFKGGKVTDVLNLIKSEFRKIESGSTFSPVFVDDLFRKMYRKEETFNQVVLYGAIIAILLAVGGLFALTYFAVVKRTKEIGIRKVLGATTSLINIHLIREFFKWVGAANIIAWPVAYIILNSWLKNFAYTIELNPSYFASATLLSFLLAFVTIVYLTTRAASRQPAENIRYE